MRIRRLGVVGAGTMGSGIAALSASAGIPVVLLDIPAEKGDRNGVARAGLERAKKAKPAAFMDLARASAITVGNTEDDLDKLAGCDLVIEAIIEQVAPKRTLYEKLERLLPAHAIVASNTSGIPMRELLEGRGPAFRARFLGMHFFNPPRYLHLLEIIPTAETSPDTLEAAKRFSDRILGKGIVLAKDVPGFVANRLGRLRDGAGDQPDREVRPVDRRGRPADRNAPRPVEIGDLPDRRPVRHRRHRSRHDRAQPVHRRGLHAVEVGAGADQGGSRRREERRRFLQEGREGDHDARLEVGRIPAADKAERPRRGKVGEAANARALRGDSRLAGKYGDFAREYLLRFSHYVLQTAPVIAYDIPAVDHAMEWGYAWELGPFKQMDLLGADFLTKGFAAFGLKTPPLLERANEGFYKKGGELTVLSLDDVAKSGTARYVPVPVERDVFSLELVRHTSGHSNDPKLAHSDDATVWNAGGVAVLEFHSKMNSLGKGVIEMLHRALDIVDEQGLSGLVIGNEDPRTFTAGADLMMIAGLVQAGDWKAMEAAVRGFQDTSMRIRFAPFPVVAAPFGLTLGGWVRVLAARRSGAGARRAVHGASSKLASA